MPLCALTDKQLTDLISYSRSILRSEDISQKEFNKKLFDSVLSETNDKDRAQQYVDVANSMWDRISNKTNQSITKDRGAFLVNNPILPQNGNMATSFNLDKKSTSESIINNIRRIGYVHHYNGETYLTKTVIDRGETVDVSTENAVRMDTYLLLLGISPDNVYTYKKSYNGKSHHITFHPDKINIKDAIDDNTNSHKVEALVTFLERRFPAVKVKWVTAKEFRELLPTTFGNSVNSFVKDGVVYLDKSRTTNNIAVEEMMHPFVASLYHDNRKLFRKLLSDAEDAFPALHEQIKDSYNGKRGFTENDREQELVSQVLARHFNEEHLNNAPEGLKSTLKEFFKWLKDLFEKTGQFVYGEKYRMSVDVLPSNLTFADIAKLINTTDTE